MCVAVWITLFVGAVASLRPRMLKDVTPVPRMYQPEMPKLEEEALDERSTSSAPRVCPSVLLQQLRDAAIDINVALRMLKKRVRNMGWSARAVRAMLQRIELTDMQINDVLNKTWSAVTDGDANNSDAWSEQPRATNGSRRSISSLRQVPVRNAKVTLTVRPSSEKSTKTVELEAGGHCVGSYKVCCFKHGLVDVLLAKADSKSCGHQEAYREAPRRLREHNIVYRRASRRLLTAQKRDSASDRSANYFVIRCNKKIRAHELIRLVRDVFGGPPDFDLPADWNNDEEVVPTLEDSGDNVCHQTVAC